MNFLFIIKPIYNATECFNWPVLQPTKGYRHLSDKLIKTTEKEFMKRIQITSDPNTLTLHDRIYVPACCPGGLVLWRYTLKSSPLKNQWLAWLMEERVVIHQVFSQRACFCLITRLRGKESDASRKQTSQEMICETLADERQDSVRGWWKEITKCKQKWNWLPSRKFPLFALERGSTKMNKLINKGWLLSRAFDIP